MVLRRIDLTPSPPSPAPPQLLPVPNPTPSYWLSQPHKHHSLRSTPALPESCDIAIIGSGMAGVLTAYHILQSLSPATTRGTHTSDAPTVVLLEARTLCSGATGRNGGHVKVKTSTLASLDASERDEFAALVARVIDELKDVVDAEDGLSEECEFELRASFDVFLDANEGQRVRTVFDAARRCGEGWTKSRAVLGRMVGVSSVCGAEDGFASRAASLWPYKFVTGLVERMVDRFAALNVQTNTPVTDVSAAAEDGGRSGSVLTTSRGVVRAKKVVFATNAYTAGLLPAYAETIVPVKGMATHIVPRKRVVPHLNNTYNIHFAPDEDDRLTGADYLNPRPDGGIVVGGGGWRFRNDRASWHNNFDDSTRFGPYVEKHWEGYMQRVFRGWEDSGAESDYTWTGIMGNTGDGKPHVGRVVGSDGRSMEGQWMLAGFNGGGMAMIAVLAKAVAIMVLEGKDFEEVRAEFGIPRAFGTTAKRTRKAHET